MTTGTAESTGGTEECELAVTRLNAGVWILRLLEPLEGSALIALRETLRDAFASDVHDVVVDLGSVVGVSVDGAATLAVAAEIMRERGGALWVAAAWEEGAGYTLRPVNEPARGGLAGISPALDRALDRALECTARANLAWLRAA